MRYSVVLAGLGLVVSGLSFVSAPDLLLFVRNVALSFVALLVAGYWIDTYAHRKVLAALGVMVLFVLIVGHVSMTMLFYDMALCEGYLGVRENTITGECRIMLIDCNPPAWYWEISERCTGQFDVLIEQQAREHCQGRPDIEACVDQYRY